MKLSLPKTAALGVLTASLIFSSAFAEGTEPGQDPLSKELMEDTVLCMKNTSDEPIVAIVWEGFKSYAGNTRPVALKPGKTACLRYQDVIKIKPDFYFVADGTFKPRRFRGACSRLKNGMARFYLLSRTEDGGKICVEDKTRSKDSIRKLVKDAKSITR